MHVSPTMLAAVRDRFGASGRVDVIDHDIARPLPAIGTFDAIVASFPIHHCSDERERELYSEVFSLLDRAGSS